MNSAEFRKQLLGRARHAGIEVPADQLEQLEAYFTLLARWNETINLTGIPVDDPTDDTFDRLLIEPLAAAGHLDPAWAPWVDIGSGGGSPAIPLKIAKPWRQLTMVESKSRKAAFLREAVRALGLEDVLVEAERAEHVADRPDLAASVGLVTIRAVRTDVKLISGMSKLLCADGRLAIFTSGSEQVSLEGFKHERSVLLTSSSQRHAYLVVYKPTFHVEQSAEAD